MADVLPVLVVRDENTAEYGFPDGHPFSPDRHASFHAELESSGLAAQVTLVQARMASSEELLTYHTQRYMDFVREACATGSAPLDGGDTPAFPGLYEATCWVVGGTLNLLEAIMRGEAQRAFIPVGGLHHAGRDHAAGFCVFNDAGIVAEMLRARYGVQRIAYVDIDAHHGDGFFYAFEDDPEMFIADIHEDGRALFPGTGKANETGKGAAEGTKLNIPLRPRADDARFMSSWERVEAFLEEAQPEFIMLLAGADSVAGDPLTHLNFSADAHAYAARRLCAIADKYAGGRVLAMGGGGYNHENLAQAWTGVVREFVKAGR